MPTKWLQERTNGSKNEPGIGFEGPGVDSNIRRIRCRLHTTPLEWSYHQASRKNQMDQSQENQIEQSQTKSINLGKTKSSNLRFEIHPARGSNSTFYNLRSPLILPNQLLAKIQNELLARIQNRLLARMTN